MADPKNTTVAPVSSAPSVAKSKSFLSEVWVELNKVTWPSKQEAWRLTLVVLSLLLVVGVFVGVLNGVLGVIMRRILV